MTGPTIEICVEGVDGLIAAQQGGADRVELCASLLEGGITPSLGTVRVALQVATIPFFVMVRPRGGDFLYSPAEYRTMLEDIEAFKALGVPGVVFGCLTPEGRIDVERMTALTEVARPMGVTCHRAFDMTRDFGEAVDDLVRSGVDRVLTSGGRDSAMEGLDNLAAIVAKAAGRLSVMACGGLDEGNIATVRDRSHAPELHFAALTTVPGGMLYRNPDVGMGGTDKDREYSLTVTDAAKVAAIINVAKRL